MTTQTISNSNKPKAAVMRVVLLAGLSIQAWGFLMGVSLIILNFLP